MPGLNVRYKVIYTEYEANADNTNAIRRQTCFDTVAECEHSRKQDGTDLKTLYRMLNKGLGHYRYSENGSYNLVLSWAADLPVTDSKSSPS